MAPTESTTQFCNPVQEFYYRLISLPLFTGLTREDSLEIAGRARFDFHRLKQGDNIVMEGQICQELHFIIQGDVLTTERAIDGSFILEEYVTGPCVIQPESLFGRCNRYSRTVTANSEEVQVLTVSKRDVRDILFTYTPFHLNYLNYICARHQNLKQRLWLQSAPDLRSQFVEFLHRRCEYPAGQKRLISGMNELAAQLHATRLNISRLLHELKEESLIRMHRGEILIPAFELLLKH